MFTEDNMEPVVTLMQGAYAIVAALEQCAEYNYHHRRLDMVWRFLSGDNNGHIAVMDYLCKTDWAGTLGQSPQFEDIEHCLLAFAFAATLSGIEIEDVIL